MSEQNEQNQENLDDIVTVSLEFIRAATELYGIDKGEAVWRAVGDAVGPEVRNAVMIAMLTGRQSNLVRITRITNNNNMVPFIKALRSVTNMGLREAKDIFDGAMAGKQSEIVCHSNERAAFIKELRSLGAIVS